MDVFNFIKGEIRMSNNTGPWLPYNLDNSPHRCKQNKNGNGSSKGSNGVTNQKPVVEYEDITYQLEGKVHKVKNKLAPHWSVRRELASRS